MIRETGLRVTALIPIFLCASATQLHAERPPKTVIIICDRMSLATIAGEKPYFRRLIKEGAIGCINILGAHGTGTPNAAITLNSGTKADADEASGQMLHTSEVPVTETGTAAEIFRRRTGLLPPDNAIVNLFLGRTLQMNIPPSVPHEVHVGAVGDAVHSADGHTAAVGNADTGLEGEGGSLSRFGALIAMDSAGMVDQGNVSRGLLVRDPNAPYGLRLDLDPLKVAVTDLIHDDRVRLVVVDFGDTYRADTYASQAMPEQAQRFKDDAFARADQFANDLVEKLDPQIDVLILMPFSFPRFVAGELAPVIVWGGGFRAGSMVTSGSTKREGVVTLPDVSATIFERMIHALPPYALGRPVIAGTSTRSEQDRLNRLVSLNRCVFTTDRYLRRTTFAAIGIFESLSLLLCAAAIAWGASGPPGLRIAGMSMLKILLWAYAILYIGNGTIGPFGLPVWIAIAEVILCLAIQSRVARILGGRDPAITGALLIWNVILFTQLFTEFQSEFNTICGYSSYYGGRYYGIGNVTTAVLLGWGLAQAGWFVDGHPDNRPRTRTLILIGLWMLFLTLVIGFPKVGSDFGGAVGAVFTFAPAWLKLAGLRLRPGAIVGMAVALALLIAALAMFDANRPPEERSHLGRWVATIQQEGTSPIRTMFVNKARIWGGSFRHWYWDVCLVSIVIACAIVFGFCRTHVRDVLQRYPAYVAILYGAVIGGVITFLLNDSGPVIPCLTALYVLAPLFYLLLRQEQRKDFSQSGG